MKSALVSLPLLLLVACSNSKHDVAQTSQAIEQGDDDENPLPYLKAELAKAPVDTWTKADELVLAPVYIGDDNKGSMLVPQWRGSGAAIEEYVYAPPDHDCRKLKGTVRVDWDSSKNEVRVIAKYVGLTPHPSVQRTEGVDYFKNPFHDFPKDFNDGAYRLWIILESTTRLAKVYYDPQTLVALGDEFMFPNGPPNNGAVITIQVPAFALTGSNAFDPDKNGYGFVDYTIPYNDLQVQNHAFSVAYNLYVPQNLCLGTPAAPARGQLRPMVGPWLPTGQGITWKQALVASVGFDLQIERRGDDTQKGNLPYIHGGVAYIGNGPGVQGGIPRGYAAAIPAQIQNVSPVIFPVPGSSSLGCKPYLNDPHINAHNFCGP